MRTLFLLASLCWWGHSLAQITFNKRFFENYYAMVFTSIYPTDSCYYAMGIVADTIYPYQTQTIFAKFDLNGDLNLLKVYGDTVAPFETWRDALRPTHDGCFINVGDGWDSTTTMNSFLIKLTPQGDTLWTRKFRHPFIPNGFIRAEGLAVLDSSGFVATFTTDSLSRDLDYYIVRLDTAGHILWTRRFDPTRQRRESFVKPRIKRDGNILLFGVQDNLNSPNPALLTQNLLIQLSPFGQVMWKFWTNIHIGIPEDMIETADGGYLVATAKGYPDSWNPAAISYNPFIYKLDANRNILWERELVGVGPAQPFTMKKVFERPNGDIFAFGISSICPPDTQLLCGMLAGFYKLSPQGDSLWARYLYNLDDYGAWNILQDAQPTPDGGFILCGQINRTIPNEPYQQGWLMKIDSFGCLIPGCQLNSVQIPDAPIHQFLIYPNPAHTQAQVYLRLPRVFDGAYFQLVDLSGRVLLQQPIPVADATFVFDTTPYPSGTYQLIVHLPGFPPTAKPLVILHP